MCESCQRPASNGIIVPRDSGPLTTSALEKSQKQTAQCKQDQLGQPSRGRAHRSTAATGGRVRPQLRGLDQTPRRPQHDPPRRSGTVGASLFPSSRAWAPGSELLSCQPSSLAKGPRFSGERSPLDCVPVHSAGTVSKRATRRELNSFLVFVARERLGL